MTTTNGQETPATLAPVTAIPPEGVKLSEDEIAAVHQFYRDWDAVRLELADVQVKIEYLTNVKAAIIVKLDAKAIELKTIGRGVLASHGHDVDVTWTLNRAEMAIKNPPMAQ